MRTISVKTEAEDAKVAAAQAKHSDAWDAHALASKRGEFTEDLWAAKVAAQVELQAAVDVAKEAREAAALKLFREDKSIPPALKDAVEKTAQAARAWDALREIDNAYRAAGAPIPPLVPMGMPTARGSSLLQVIVDLCVSNGIPVPSYFAEEIAKQAEEGARMGKYLESAQWSQPHEAPVRVVGAGTH